MKRRDLLRYLSSSGCEQLRGGATPVQAPPLRRLWKFCALTPSASPPTLIWRLVDRPSRIYQETQEQKTERN